MALGWLLAQGTLCEGEDTNPGAPLENMAGMSLALPGTGTGWKFWDPWEQSVTLELSTAKWQLRTQGRAW